ncbi:MAG: hypothetical protein LW875_02445 [Proteobacteria bacterium]|nr:hypothetical protein [Pseudomonadota bacterium]
MPNKAIFLQGPGLCKVLGSRSGQAVTEYVLLIAIVLVLLLMLANKVIKPMKAFTDSYMGSYIECLIDVGELPSLGFNNTVIDSECNTRFEPFDPLRGRPPRQVVSNGPEGSSQGERSQVANSPRAGSGSQPRGRRSTALDMQFRNNPGSGADATGGKESNQRIVAQALPESRFQKVGSIGGGGTSGSVRRIENRGFTSWLGQEREKAKQREERLRKVASVDGQSAPGTVKKMVVKPPARKIIESEAEFELGFGKIFRIAIIVAIILALLFFIGGQALQISKSMEK